MFTEGESTKSEGLSENGEGKYDVVRIGAGTATLQISPGMSSR